MRKISLGSLRCAIKTKVLAHASAIGLAAAVLGGLDLDMGRWRLERTVGFIARHERRVRGTTVVVESFGFWIGGLVRQVLGLSVIWRMRPSYSVYSLYQVGLMDYVGLGYGNCFCDFNLCIEYLD